MKFSFKIKCCGLVSYSDWFTTEWASRNQSVPLSCCINKLKCLHLNMNLNNITDIYQEVIETFQYICLKI